MLLAASLSGAQVVEIRWDESGVFERTVELAPGRYAELCGRLTRGLDVDWSFRSGQPLDFNIHYHVGKDVVFPAKQAGAASLNGGLQVVVEQDYCWMWENKSSAPATVDVVLRRR